MPGQDEFPIDDIDMEEYEQQGRRRHRRGWIPWLVLLLVLLVVAWLICRYSDFGRAPDVKSVGATIKLARVPDVVGLNRAEALSVMKAAGFKVEAEQSFDAVASPDTVVSQDPVAGQRVARGSTVFVSIASEMKLTPGQAAKVGQEAVPRIPDVVGMTVDDAKATLATSGFGATVSPVYSLEVPEGQVTAQTPEGGSAASGGETVGLMISMGPKPGATVEVPKLTGLSKEAAIAGIRAAGLEPRVMYQPNPSSVGEVYEQSPAPGEMVPTDRYVFIMVGAQP